MIFTTTFAALGLTGTLATLPGTLELGALTLASLSRPRSRRGDPLQCGRLAVVVPAHNEALGITRCIRSLQNCEQPPNGARVVVIADNCSDDTAEVARSAGAEVLERHDEERRGKGYALEVAFEEVLRDEDVEAVLIVDADTLVAPNFLVEMAAAFAGGADGTQCPYDASNAEDSTRTRLAAVALAGFNRVRPAGRERLGLSVGILGNGFGLHRRVLEVLPYTARSVVEDLEYHLMMVSEGFAVRFVPSTSVAAPIPTTDEGANTQRARWEGGRFRMIGEHVPRLLSLVRRGRLDLIEPTGELLLLPLASHVGALGVLVVIPFLPTQLYALTGLCVVAAHVAVALRERPRDEDASAADDLAALASVPGYVLRKAAMLPQLLRASRRDQTWVRTKRDEEEDVVPTSTREILA